MFSTLILSYYSKGYCPLLPKYIIQTKSLEIFLKIDIFGITQISTIMCFFNNNSSVSINY